MGVPISKTLAIWASPSLLPQRFGLGLGLQGMSISLGFWEWGCPKCKDAHITVTAKRKPFVHSFKNPPLLRLGVQKVRGLGRRRATSHRLVIKVPGISILTEGKLERLHVLVILVPTWKLN